jgi:hypothetical protein
MLAGCPFIPTSVDCQNGVTAVQQMDSVFQSAPASTQVRFQSAHDTIMQSFNSMYSWYTCWTEMSNGAICDLGQQATALMGQIQTMMGQEPTPGIPGGPGTDYMTLLVIGVVVYLAMPLLLSRR